MKIVILGATAAGAKAAAKARRLRPDAKIYIYTDDTHVSYSACGLPYYIEGNFEDYRMLLVRSPEEFEAQDVHVNLQHRATKIMPESKQVLIYNMQEHNSFIVEYDKLLIATGARTAIPPIANINLQNIFTLRKIEDGIAIRDRVRLSKHAVIIGGGYIGIEILEAFVRQGIYTTLIEAQPYIMRLFDEELSQTIKEQFTSIAQDRFEILTSETVTEFLGDINGINTVRTSSGKSIPADLVVLATGAVPNVEIARDAGITIGVSGAISVNTHMETNIPDIYAAGDCAETYSMITGGKIWTPLGSIANKEGRCAAMNLCGFEDAFPGVLGSSVTRCLDFTMSKTGLTEKEAREAGYTPISATVRKHDKVGYMPDTKDIIVKLVADEKTGRMLGAQGIGMGDVDKRVNIFASALLGKLTVEEFLSQDLTYAPPYSPTIDPLLNAAQILDEKLAKNGASSS